MFDPSGGDHYGFALRGETLIDGQYQELNMVQGTDGNVSGYSPVLNLELHWREGRLRFYDPVGDRWLENIEETGARAQTAEAEREIERSAREQAETERLTAETERDIERSAREQAETERLTAESRVAQLEAEIRRLRGQ